MRVTVPRVAVLTSCSSINAQKLHYWCQELGKHRRGFVLSLGEFGRMANEI